MLHYRLGLDMGTNSLGWCAVQVRKDGSPVSLLNMGVRIFDDGREPAKKDVPGESSAVQRRAARGMRRRYDRKLMRKKATLRELIKTGLMPEDKEARKKLEAMEPLKLRSDAISRKLDNPYEIGRALFHLQQRRGFKSNRKDAQKEGDNKIDGMKLGIRDLENTLASRTLGQFLYEEYQKDGKRKSTRFHARMEKNKAKYDYYPTRKMVEEEFSAIWETQKKHHPHLLTEVAKQAIHKAIFHQRKLKPQPKGSCSIITSEERMAWAMPTTQHFRIAKEIANLRIQRTDDHLYKGEELEKRQKLTEEQRKTLFEALCRQGSMTFNQIKGKKYLYLDSSVTFNLEVPPRKGLDGDKTAAIMRGSKKGARFPGWDDLTLEQQDSIVEKLLCDDESAPGYMEDETLAQWLIDTHHLTPAQADSVVNAPLPASYAKFGKTVITNILPKMWDKGLMEHAALKECGYDPGDQYTGEICDKLPYYGKLLEGHVVRNEKSSDPMVREYGRVANPTVHIALNQLKRLMNTLKDRYGCWPQEIVVEMARELKKGRTEVVEIIKEIEKNTKDRDTCRKEIAKHRGIPEENVSPYDIDKMKLWYELEGDATHRKCVFSGEMINLTRLFDDIEIEHILPRSQTLDNTSANKTLATREANRIKRNRPPYEAFKNETGKYAYDAIWERAQALPKSKRWRFHQDAMKTFEEKARKIILKSSLGTEEIDTELEPFAARQLNDTSYVAKLAKKYLAYACEEGKNGVRVTPGTLTGLLRKAWGLNTLLHPDETDEKIREQKNRNDHRHHAIDALVIALTDIRTVQQVQYASAREEEERAKGNDAISVKKVLGNDKPVIISDRPALEEAVERLKHFVSHKPDHGSPRQATGKGAWNTSGRLHEDTYYGLVKQKPDKTWLLRVRVPLPSLAKDVQGKPLKLRKIFENISSVADAHLRDTLIKALASCLNATHEPELLTMAKKYNGWMVGNIAQPEQQKKEEKKQFRKRLDELEKTLDAEKLERLLSNFEATFGKKTIPVHSVRIYEEKTSDVPVKVKTYDDETPWKLAVGGDNQRAEIYCQKSGSNAENWQIEFIKAFDANKRDFIPKWKQNHPDAELIMTLYKGDIVAYEEDGILVVRKIIVLPNSGQIFLTPNHLAKPTTKTPPSIRVSGMQERNFRKLYVEIDGSVYDPLGELTTPRVAPEAAA